MARGNIFLAVAFYLRPEGLQTGFGILGAAGWVRWCPPRSCSGEPPAQPGWPDEPQGAIVEWETLSAAGRKGRRVLLNKDRQADQVIAGHQAGIVKVVEGLGLL